MTFPSLYSLPPSSIHSHPQPIWIQESLPYYSRYIAIAHEFWSIHALITSMHTCTCAHTSTGIILAISSSLSQRAATQVVADVAWVHQTSPSSTERSFTIFYNFITDVLGTVISKPVEGTAMHVSVWEREKERERENDHHNGKNFVASHQASLYVLPNDQ